MANDNRTDHDILICVEQKVEDVRTEVQRVCRNIERHDRKIVAQEEQVVTLFRNDDRQNGNLKNHKKNHLWWGGALLTIIGIIVSVSYWIISRT